MIIREEVERQQRRLSRAVKTKEVENVPAHLLAGISVLKSRSRDVLLKGLGLVLVREKSGKVSVSVSCISD